MIQYIVLHMYINFLNGMPVVDLVGVETDKGSALDIIRNYPQREGEINWFKIYQISGFEIVAMKAYYLNGVFGGGDGSWKI